MKKEQFVKAIIQINYKIFFTSLFVVMELVVFSQSRPVLIPYRKGELWGYCDTSKKIIIPIKYHRAFPFINGKALVETKKDSGLVIDTKGKVLWHIPYQMNDYIEETGLMRFTSVEKNGNTHKSEFRTGLINLEGTVVLQPDYETVEVLGEDSFEVVLPGKKGVINSKLKVLREFIPFNDSDNDQQLLMTINANPSDTPKMWGPFSDGMAIAIANRQFGYCNENMKLVIPCKYEMAESFRYGLAKVSIKAPKQPKKSKSKKLKSPPPPPGFENAIEAEVTVLEEGYIDKMGTEYWED